MDAAKLGQAVEAIGQLVAGQEAPAKPNVKDVEDVVGFDMTAAERDEAWQAFEGGDKLAPNKPAPTSEKPKGSAPEVKNLHSSPMSVQGVTIPPGESRAVPGFDPKHGVVAKWLKAGILSA